MWRTYKSKKDVGDGLDHREMMRNIDDKSSAFDAFYIQNIKHTKREQSCMGSSNQVGVSRNKVRKRKYVKKIVKEVEVPPRESLSGSVFLTPDKSLRVNKAQDLFDQLLNSSPACSGPKERKNENLFNQLLTDTTKDTKTYNRNRAVVKKYNFSSSESSESDKENLKKQSNISVQNATDILSHELVIEKETAPIAKVDDSINKIVGKLSQLNKYKRNSNGGFQKAVNCNKNRLTLNIQSPLLKTSPLSSTPFTGMQRSQSIYRFSPIPMANLEDSPNYDSVLEDDNDFNKSIVFFLKNSNSGNALKLSQNEKRSPVAHFDGTGQKTKETSQSLFSSEADIQSIAQNDLNKNSGDKKNTEESTYLTKDLSMPQTSEVEPFVGFRETTETYDNSITEDKDGSIILSSANISKRKQDSAEPSKKSFSVMANNDNVTDVTDGIEINNSSIEYSASIQPFIGFEEQDISQVNLDMSVANVQEESALNISEVSENCENTEGDDSTCSQSSKLDDTEESALDLKDNDRQTMYDTCSSASLTGEDINKEPIIKLDRLNTSLFNRYYEKAQNSDAEYEELHFTEDNVQLDRMSTSNLLITENDENACNNGSDKEEIEAPSYKEAIVKLDRMNTSLFNKYYKREPHGDLRDNDRKTMYDTCNSASLTEEDINKEPIIKLDRLNTSLLNRYYEQAQNSDAEYEELNFTEDNVQLDQMSTSNLLITENDENACNNGSDNEEIEAPSYNEAIVKLDRMNTSLFNKYYMGESHCVPQSEEISEEQSLSDDSASFMTGINSDGDESNYDEQSLSTNAEIDNTSTEEDVSGKETDSDSKDTGQSTDEERRLCFVTTRRRHEYTNNATILVLDDSEDSISSGDCNNTVLNNKLSPKQELNAGKDIVINENEVLKNETSNAHNQLNTEESEVSISLVTSRESKLTRESISVGPNTSMAPEIKTGIILQPGKKWERSLSIYRRMTTMSDNFDHSLIDEEDLHNKGRKYRQSVIQTMEMQGSLQNESIHSRRSTIVPKPSRSTIRIVKEPSNSRISLSSTTAFDDLKGFLEDCDDTIVELSKLSISDDLDVTVLDKHQDSRFHDSRIASARDYVLRRCNQLDTLPFDECYPDSALKNCRKIGEGVYGEVFLWRAPDGRARVMKVVPIAGDVKVNGEHQKDFHEVISEIVIAMELSALRAPIAEIECHLEEGKELDAIDLHSVENATDVFNEVLGVKCVFGSYPSRLLDLWELYDESRGSENDSPAALPPHQQYMVLELANAGQDLESYCFASAEQAHALLLQIAFALAVGEEAFQFEHRDLHWGNVLIAPTDQKYATFVLRGRCHRVARRGVAATIIDYSLSRVSLPLAGGAHGADSAALYNDLAADEGLFAAVGDYQFQLYRLMRDKLGNDWKNFEPYTNVLWLHYTVDKMITALRYQRTNTKTHKQYINKLKAIRERLLSYGSAVQFVLTDNEF